MLAGVNSVIAYEIIFTAGPALAAQTNSSPTLYNNAVTLSPAWGAGSVVHQHSLPSKQVNHHHNYLPLAFCLPSIKFKVLGFPLCAARILSARTPGGGRRNVSISLYYGPPGRGQAGKLYSPPARSVM